MRINLFGGPGVGKSSVAAFLFARLKRVDLDVELVQEFVKIMAYQKRGIQPWDYVYTFAQQFHAEQRMLATGLPLLVTDSPLLLQSFYAEESGCPVGRHLRQIAMEFSRSHGEINFFIERDDGGYNPVGRFHTQQEAEAIDERLFDYLTVHGVPFQTALPHEFPQFFERLACEHPHT